MRSSNASAGRAVVFVLMPFLLCGACGGDNSSATSALGRACKDLETKLAECGIELKSECIGQPCILECAAHAGCDELRSPPTGSYLVCINACGGTGDAKSAK